MKPLYKVQHIGINNVCSLNIYMFHNIEKLSAGIPKCGLFITVAGLYIQGVVGSGWTVVMVLLIRK